MASEAKTRRSRRTRAALIDALRKEVRRTGDFTADDVAAAAGCKPGTYWAHFGSNDEALLAAFSATLDDLVDLTAELFSAVPPNRSRDRHRAWAEDVVDRTVRFFASNAQIFRRGIARWQDYEPIRAAYRAAEERGIDLVEQGLDAETREDAACVLAFCQGFHNPIILASDPNGRLHRKLARALQTLAT